MKTLLNCGRWFVGACFALYGVGLLWMLLEMPDGSRDILDFWFQLGLTGTVLLCSWGVLTWKAWGHVLAAVLSFLMFVLGVAPLVAVGLLSASVSAAGLTVILLSLAIISWLFLPGVRAAYWHSKGFA